MTSIKPPQGPSTHPIHPMEPAAAAEGPSPTGPLTGPQAAIEVGATQAARPADPIAALAADVQAGRIQMSEAVERLVERTVAQLGGRLSVEERAGLGAVLREALESDPVLSSLR